MATYTANLAAFLTVSRMQVINMTVVCRFSLQFLKKLAGIDEIVSTTNPGVRLVTNVSKFYKVSFELNDSARINRV